MIKLVTKYFNIHNAYQFLESIDEPDPDNYYLTFGKHTQYANTDSTVDTPIDSLKNRDMYIYDDMIFGKKIHRSDVQLMVNKNVWVSNTIYDIYNDEEDLSDLDFYVATLDGSNYNVYKCLDNANGAPSTEMPSTVDTSTFIENDGYVWKYLYTVNSANWYKFTTTSYMPVSTNTTIKAAATDRSIDVILTDYSGSYYNNHFAGTFETGTQIVSASSFKLSGNAVAINDYYTGCVMEFTTNDDVEYREITNYVVSGSDKTVTLSEAVTATIEVGDTYQIYPKVSIQSDGFQTINCLAWALVNSNASNSISRIEILTSGEGYRDATANVVFDSSVNVTDEAILRPIVSPVNGHGYDCDKELLGHKICISVSVANNESNNIVAENDFRNIAIIKNPEFREVKLEYSGTTTIFDIGETVFQYRPIQLRGTAYIEANSNAYIVDGEDTLFEESVVANDYILVQNSSANFFGQVNSVSSNTRLYMKSEGPSITDANVFIAKVNSSGVVTTYLSNSILVTEASNGFFTDSRVIGSNSFASIVLTDVENNSRNTNDFETFQQTVRFDGGLTSANAFTLDEYVYQQGTYANENLRPKGRVFHYFQDTTDSLYITNEKNEFSSNAVLIGNTSNAVFVSSNKYNGDLIKDSGTVMYIMNVEAVSRTDSSSENIKIVISF